MIKWAKKEQFDQQDVKFHEMSARYQKAVIDSGTHIEDLKAEVEAVIKRELTEGTDLTTEKGAKRKAIADAEQAHEHAKEEQQKALEFIAEESQKDRITPADLATDWIEVYRPAVRKAQLQPIVERMAAARAEYLNATMDFYELVDEYRALTGSTRDIVNGHFSSGKHGANPNIADVAAAADLPQITDEELFRIRDGRKLPSNVARVNKTNGGK